MLRCSARKRGFKQGVSDPIAPPRSSRDRSRGTPAWGASPDCTTENSCQSSKKKSETEHHGECLYLMNLIVPQRILCCCSSSPGPIYRQTFTEDSSLKDQVTRDSEERYSFQSGRTCPSVGGRPPSTVLVSPVLCLGRLPARISAFPWNTLCTSCTPP